ncbi:multidrug resistance protein MdtN [Maioricimonas rarisocia]|uniref:Multidrug resistance protein MdtN n=1 Tax=Maioricimonas rarisocia TaxID=2528026 RepID=A0A517Z7W8_9PLAN|nr:efflux RND transporter periplasmic adaptor subunit [Maioricimonas rarisocia]QDU38582.1 multidrug resistance protein MdtN [Maioricimonas rarisocia]
MKSAVYFPAVLLIALVGLAVLTADGLQSNEAAAQPRNRFEETIVESGTIESANVLQIVSEVPGESVILRLIPDGTTVKKGDLLVQLDDSELRENHAVLQIQAKTAEDGLTAAETRLEAAKQRKTTEVAIAEQKVRVAELARKRLLDEGGELDHRLSTIERTMTLTEQQLAASKETGASAELRELQAQLETARGEKRLLQDFIRPHEAAVHELEIKTAQRELEQTQQNSQSAVVEAVATVAAGMQEVDSVRQELRRIEQSIAACQIVAPRDGVVMHANPPSRRTNASVLEEGATVRERQPLLAMPDFDQLQARILVHESQIDRVKVGQSASLQLGAFPGRKIAGRVAGISRTPRSQSWINPGVVEYAVIIEIPDPPDGMGIGLTVAAEIDTGAVEER